MPAIITLGEGRKNPQGRRVTPEDLQSALEQHTGTDAWWSGHVWEDDYRDSNRWERSAVVAVDLDYGVYREETKGDARRVKSIKLDVPQDQRDKINTAWDYEMFCPTAGLGHATPHGHRVIWVLSNECTDPDEWSRSARGACQIAREALQGIGLPVVSRDNLDAPGWHVDEAASVDCGRLYFAPYATVDGNARTGKVVVRNGVTATAQELHARVPAPTNTDETRHSVSPETASRMEDATKRWATDNPTTLDPKRGERIDCPACGSEACLGIVPNLPGRFACHSESHKHLTTPLGSPSKRGSCYVFDALDLEAWRRSQDSGTNVRRSDVLRHDGYMGPTGTVEPHVEEGVKRALTDVGNAERIVDRFGHEMRYTAAHGWLIWDGTRWKKDETGQATRRAIAAVKDIYAEAIETDDQTEQKAIAKWAHTSQQRQRVEAALALARDQLGIAEHASRFDENAWILNTPSGSIDLKNGALRPPRMKDRLTKSTLVAPEHGPRTRWDEFLAYFQPDPEVRQFLKRWAGYCLTGLTGEQCFVFMYGTGANGKSTFVEALSKVAGDYAMNTPFDTFLTRRTGAATNDLARLAGARLVRASEPDSGARLSESTVKQATGGEPITARFLHREFFEFVPQFKITLVGNHKPTIQGTDHGIWRRVVLVPWETKIPKEEQTNDFGGMLAHAEGPRILQWAVEGAIEWTIHGLNPPSKILAATADYRMGEDVVGQFLGDCCDIGAAFRVSNASLTRVYTAWCDESGEKPMTQRTLAKHLVERGFSRTKSGGARGWQGFGVSSSYQDANNDETTRYK